MQREEIVYAQWFPGQPSAVGTGSPAAPSLKSGRNSTLSSSPCDGNSVTGSSVIHPKKGSVIRSSKTCYSSITQKTSYLLYTMVNGSSNSPISGHPYLREGLRKNKTICKCDGNFYIVEHMAKKEKARIPEIEFRTDFLHRTSPFYTSATIYTKP
ncbi:MAG: hypothetical protein IMZ58_01325 [Thermoplasmata archaeon]|nr:hypothetical protein [Thermoplasmata archaeon]